eukprot:g8912.t1
MRNIEEEEGGGDQEVEEGGVKRAKEVQAVSDAGGDGNVETERQTNEPHDAEEEQEDDGTEQARFSDSELDLRNHLRDDILETVDECLSAWEKGRAPASEAANDPLHRCAVCTLPHGDCEHTKTWLEDRHRQAILEPLPKDSVELTMDDISDVLAPASLASKGTNVDTTGNPSLANLRYGHVALSLDSETMWMFGGRLKGGLQASDTHTLNIRDMRWDRTNAGGDDEIGPSPRFWSAGVKVRQRVLLFGGADLLTGRIFDDVWTWDIQTRCWTEQIVVGTPPLARYGHVLVACPHEKVMVLGGCCVSTSAEDGLPVDNDRLHLRVRVAANKVDRAYELEEAEIAVGAFDSYVELGGSVPGHDRRGSRDVALACASEREEWRRLSRRQAQLAAAVAARENETNLREQELREILFEQAAMTHWAKLHSRHPLKEIDMMLLDTESMIWGAGNPPVVGGGKTTAPSARMHFSAVRLGHKVVLWGGCFPTSKRVDMVEGGVHVFDLDQQRWSTIVGERHPEGIRPRLDAAVRQLRRAERSLFEATQRAMTLGAAGGRTMQVVQAEAIIEVNRWRVQRIEDEIGSATPSLRLEEEFHLRLERERQQRENGEAEALRRAARLEERRKALELAREAAETAVMAAEDARSAIAELTIAPTPRLRCANSTTIWLEWDRPTVDAKGKSPNRHVEYTLYMSGGFREWEVGDEVLVEYMSRAQRKAATSNSSITTCSLTDACSRAEGSLTEGAMSSVTPGGGDDGSLGEERGGHSQKMFSTNDEESAQSSAGHHSLPKLLPAVITGTGAVGGLFDIRWDDGEREHGVRRNRIHRAASPRPPWTIIYQGEECRYAVEGMVPESVIERERNFPYEVRYYLCFDRP